MTALAKGDYVLATKYRDGDPFDGYAVGFYDEPLPKVGGDRFMVVDAAGNQYRRNGFRRVERISPELGDWIVTNRIFIEARNHMGPPLNIWRYKYGGEAARRGLLEGAGELAEFIARNAARYGWANPTPITERPAA